MYRLKEEFMAFFKEYRTKTYADYIGCNADYMSSVLNANKTCMTVYAIAMISIRLDLGFKDVIERNLLDKYFAKEK